MFIALTSPLPQLTVIQGDISELTVDCVVHPTNASFNLTGLCGKCENEERKERKEGGEERERERRGRRGRREERRGRRGEGKGGRREERRGRGGERKMREEVVYLVSLPLHTRYCSEGSWRDEL